jgi:hypothetical protein
VLTDDHAHQRPADAEIDSTQRASFRFARIVDQNNELILKDFLQKFPLSLRPAMIAAPAFSIRRKEKCNDTA